tara:strand:- start:47 stop:361 length:315 start_codon:yes stop_codon:yes gene_type:complete
MFNRPLILSLSIFLILMVFTSVIKNNTRNIEKNIQKLNIEISILNQDLLNAEIDFIYLSSPEKLEKKLLLLDSQKYFSYDFSRIFLSTKDYINFSSKQTKNLKK